MPRWETGARERLQAAALDLFARHGFDGVTAAQIGEAAGLTERTFFRYFADKREVLFAGQEEFEQHFLAPIAAAPADEPRSLIEAALTGAASFFPEERRAWSRARSVLIAAHPQFQERELLKMAHLASSLAAAFADRGLPPTAAEIAAQTTTSAFHVAFRQWLADGDERPFPEIVTGVLEEFRALVG